MTALSIAQELQRLRSAIEQGYEIAGHNGSYQGIAIARGKLDLLDEVKTILSKAEDLLPAVPDGWQPIETAPKDGTRILLWINKDNVDIGAYATHTSKAPPWRHGFQIGRVMHPQPTLWRPIPPAAPSPEEPTR